MFLLLFAAKRKCWQNAGGDTFWFFKFWYGSCTSLSLNGVAEFTIFHHSVSAKISCQPLLRDEIFSILLTSQERNIMGPVDLITLSNQFLRYT